MEGILRFEIAIETDDRIFQLVYRLPFLVHRSAKLAQQLLAILVGDYRLIIREESIRH